MIDPTCWESLSRLLEGDLPEREAEALRARIAADPELARAWRRMQALPAALGDLPADLGPLPSLGAGDPSSQIRSPLRAPRWLPWALAAALALFALKRPPPVSVELRAGSQLIEGEALVLAAGIPIEVDGRVQISVEPSSARERVEAAKPEESMKLHPALAALGGAAITVAVYEGRARLTPPGEAAVDIGAGESRTLDAPGSEPHRAPSVADAPAARTDRDRSQDDRIADLEAQLDEARFSMGLVRGQLAKLQGKPTAWPEDLRPAYQPDAMRAFAQEAAQGMPGVEVASVDCDEYPCIAVFRTANAGEGWEAPFQELTGNLEAHGFEGESSVMGMAMGIDGEEGAVNLYGLVVGQGDQFDEATQERTRYRADGLMRDLADEATGGTE